MPPAPSAAIFPWTIVLAERGSRATIVERVTARAGAFICGATEIVTADHADITYSTLQNLEDSARAIFSRAAAPGRDARVALATALLGGALSADELVVAIEHPGSETTISGIFFPTGTQHVDVISTVDHAAGEAASDTLVKSAARDRGQARYFGNIRIAPHAQGSDAPLRDDALLLSQDGPRRFGARRSRSAPTTSRRYHGATVGAIDAEQIFYLQSRGIEARRRGTNDRARILRAGGRALSDGEPARRNPRRISGKAGLDARREISSQSRAPSRQTFRSWRTRRRAANGWSISTRRRRRRNRKPSSTRWSTTTQRYNANIHRGVYEIAARATDAFEAGSRQGRPFHRCQARPKSSGLATRPRRSIWSLTVGACANLKPGDAILRPSSSTTPTSCRGRLLADQNRRGAALHSQSTTRPLRLRRLGSSARRVQARRRSRTSATRWARSRRSKSSSPARMPPGAVVLVDAAQGAPHMPVDVQGTRRRFLRLQRSQDARSDRHRLSLRKARAARSDAAVSLPAAT